MILRMLLLMLVFSPAVLPVPPAMLWAADDDPAPASGDDPAAIQSQIEKLIEGLDADTFSLRQSSEAKLLKLGPAAAEQLREAAEQAVGERKARLLRILRELSRSLRLIEKVTSKKLDHTTSVAISDDGKFLYTTAWKAASIGIYSIDPESGKLTEREMLTSRAFTGALSIRLCPARSLAVATCYASRSIVLFRRDQATGKLGVIDLYSGDARSPTPVFPVEASFTPDGRFLYVVDASIRFGAGRGGVMIFRITDENKLQWIDTHVGEDGCFSDARGMVMHPSKPEIYVTASAAASLVRAAYDPETGELKIKQVLRDGEDSIEGLAGAMSVTTDREGKFVYTSSGRFSGDSAVSVFAFNGDGDLKVVQELISGRDPIGKFLGGNELVVAPDGKHVYATATRSSTMAGFARDATTGKLQYIETEPLGRQELGPAGVTVSDDNRNVYVAVEGESAIAVFRRD